MSNITPEQRKGWAGTCDTVRVKADNEQGFAVINAEDFDKDVHERHTEREVATGEATDVGTNTSKTKKTKA